MTGLTWQKLLMIKKNKKTLFLLCLFLLLAATNSVLALEINYPRLPGATPPQDFVGTAPPEQIVSLYALYIFNLAIWLTGVIALGVLIYAGFLYLISTGKPERIASARDKITGAFLGIMLLLSSYIVLQILNPQLTILQIPELKPPKVIEKIDVPGLTIKPLKTSIDAEIPMGRILEEKVFASSTMASIKENAGTTLDIAKKLEELNRDLENKTGQCSCPQTKSICTPCVTKPPSTSDPCKSVRGDIEGIQQDIVNEIGKLMEEQKKTAEEVRLLREELTKIERTRNYLPNECRLWTAQSLSEFLIKVDNFESEEGKLRQIKFWDDMTSIRQKDQTRDWASFYCPVGGTMFTEQPPPPALEAPRPEIPEEYTNVVRSCPQEAPLGDILDRAKRTGYKLVERMEQLLQKGDELIEAVAKMQVSVSECSSRRCTSVCIPTKKGCIKLPPVGAACPFGEIAGRLSTIAEIVEEIEKVVREARDEEIGIIPIIDKKVPSILQDWNREVWLPMQQCVAKGGDRVLFDTQRAVGALDPEGVVIRTACESEPVFLECQESCYLKEDQANYGQCLNACLDEKAQQFGVEEIGWCRNRLNFFCCNVTQELIE